MGCSGWPVVFATAEVWTGPDGKPSEFVAGECRNCRSRVLVAPRQRAVEAAAARLGAAAAIRRVAGDG
jgi:DNA-directed RNA polymerase subunit RPC12/RpoP